MSVRRHGFESSVLIEYDNGLCVVENEDYDVTFMPPPYVFYEVMTDEGDLLETTNDLQWAMQFCKEYNK